MNLLKQIVSSSIKLWVGFLFLFLSVEIYSVDPPIVFVSRNLVQGGSIYYPAEGLLPGMGPYSRFAVVGGRLLVRESNGTIRVLVDSTITMNGINLIDVSDPCVLWNGNKIIFSGITSRDSSWRIFEINADGSNLRRVTSSNRIIPLVQFGPAAFKFIRYDDIDPCYLPDGRICFASSRFPSLSQFGVRTTNLYVINSDGTDLHRITTERNGAEEPTIDPTTGRIVYSRWWLNIDMASNLTQNRLTRDSSLALSTDVANIWQSARIRPDGDALEMYGGWALSRQGINNYKPTVLNDSTLIGTFVPHAPMIYTTGSSGIRAFNPRFSEPQFIAGVNPSNMQIYISNPPSFGTMQPPYAVDPTQIPDGRILFSYATQVENQDYGLYTINLNGAGLQPFYDIPGKLELDAQVLLPKSVPPIVPDLMQSDYDELPPTIDPSTYFKNGGFRFDCVNIFTNAAVDVPIGDGPPIKKFARIKFFLNFQRTDTSGRDSVIYLDQSLVNYSGSIHFDLAPADVSMFEQVVDSAGGVIKGSQGQVAHVSGMNFGRIGAGTKCVGCHAGHTNIPVPPTLSEGEFFNISTSANVTQSSYFVISDTNEFKGKKVIDRKARNDSMRVNWIANGGNNEFVNLRWDIPIDVKSVVLYNIKPNPGNGTNIQVQDCEVFFYFEGNQVDHIASTGPISVNGSRYNLPQLRKCDEVKVIVKSFTGQILGQNKSGLAEVETIARISYYDIIGIHRISELASKFELYQNYPNPFNPVTKIKYSIPSNINSPKKVTLLVFDITGREVARLVDNFQRAGVYETDFNAVNLASGIYLYKLDIGGEYSETKKMVVLK